MNQTKLSAYTPIYQLYDKRIITLKTYKWLNRIGVQNVEELAMAYQVVGKTQLYDALPKAFRTELRAITTQTLSKTTQNTLLMPSITLPVTTQMHLQQLFDKRLAAVKSSYILNWFHTDNPNYAQAVALFGLRYIDYLYRYGTGVEVWQLYDLVQWFEACYSNTISQLNRLSTQQAKPVSTDIFPLQEQPYIKQFKRTHGHEPLLYLLYQLLSKSDDRNFTLVKRVTGLHLMPPESKEEVAKSIHRTVSRLRDILNDVQQHLRQRLLPNADWSPYQALFTQPFLTADHSMIQQVIAEELPELDGARVLSLLSACGKYKTVEVNQSQLLIHEDYITRNEIVHAESWINYKLRIRDGHARKTNQRHLDFEATIARNPYLQELMRYLLSKAMGNALTQEAFVKWKNKAPDPSSAAMLYQILKESGKPMYIKELMHAFNAKHPHSTPADLASIRNMLRVENKRIRPIGRRSLYALAEWNDLFFGTVCDCIEQILLPEEEPLPLQQILSKIQEVFPHTSLHNLESQIRYDSKKRFVRFKAQYIGLNAKTYTGQYELSTNYKPRSFEENIQELEAYVKTHHCYPTSPGPNFNRALYKWYLDIRKKRIVLTTEQSQKLEALFTRHVKQYHTKSSNKNKKRRPPE